MKSPNLQEALRIYELARHFIDEAGFGAEVRHHREIVFSEFSEQDLLRESAWVILCSGFRETVVRQKFDFLSLAFCDWESAEEIVDNQVCCAAAAKSVFRNDHKIVAITEVAKRIHESGFATIKQDILLEPLLSLMRLPYMGPITTFHLAKNLGLDVAKPDRHLARFSKQLGFANSAELCEQLSNAAGETVRIVDLILWRYFASNHSMPRGLLRP